MTPSEATQPVRLVAGREAAPRPFLLQAHSAPTRLWECRRWLLEPCVASAPCPGTQPASWQAFTGSQGAGMEDAGQGGGRHGGRPARLRGSPHSVQGKRPMLLDLGKGF